MQNLHPARKFSSSTFSTYEIASRAVRDLLGLDRLSRTQAAEVRAAVQRHTERAERKIHHDPLVGTMTRLRNRLQSEVYNAVSPLLDDLFKMATSSWAGGTTYDSVTISTTPRASGRTDRVWSSNKKWSGNDLHRHVAVMPAWRRQVQARGIAVLDGMLTTHAELVRDIDGVEVYRASWVRQGRGYDLMAESGHIAYHRASGTTYHLKGSDPAKAAAGLKRKLKAQAIPAGVRDAARSERAQKRQERQAAKLARLVERLARWDLAGVEDVEVRRSDSLRAGNCVSGTAAFIDRYFPDRDSATIGEIARRIGRLDVTSLTGADLTLARQVGAACLVAIRRDRQARRLVLA
jgi:hypothetical protein